MNVFETSHFANKKSKLTTEQLLALEQVIELVIHDPNLGTQRKADLKHVRIYAHPLEQLELLLAYQYQNSKITLLAFTFRQIDS